MDFILKNLEHFAKIISWLSIRKVLLLATTMLAALVLFTAYEQRVRLAELFVGKEDLVTSKFVVSMSSQDNIKLLVSRNPLIKTVVVLTADIHLNRRTVLFRFSDDPASNEIFEKMLAEKGPTQPIFNDNPVNNQQMVSLINGEYTCSPARESIYHPTLAAGGSTICRVSLPPYYGDFAGYIAVILVRAPSSDEEQQLEQLVKALSNELFFKDIQRR